MCTETRAYLCTLWALIVQLYTFYLFPSREKLKAAFTLLSDGTEGVSFDRFLLFVKEYKPETRKPLHVAYAAYLCPIDNKFMYVNF